MLGATHPPSGSAASTADASWLPPTNTVSTGAVAAPLWYLEKEVTRAYRAGTATVARSAASRVH